MNKLIIYHSLLRLRWRRTVFFTDQRAYEYHKLCGDNPIDVPHSRVPWNRCQKCPVYMKSEFRWERPR